jgi:peroxiredoxin
MDERTQKGLFAALQIGFVGVAAVAVYGFVSVSKEAEHRRSCTAECLVRPDYAGADRKAPDFALKDMNGQDVKLTDYRGKVVVLNFWTRTCGPCMKEMPSIGELTEILAPKKDVAVVTISVDEGPDDVRDTLGSMFGKKLPFPVLFDPDGDGVVRGKFGTKLFPETWIIDKKGVIRARFDGGRDWSSATMVELIDQIREGGYCPLAVNKDHESTLEAADRICQPMTGG